MTASWSPEASPAPARRVGRYVLFEEFARGGMASVHFARLVGAAGFSRVVAVKRVRSVFVDSDEHRRALLREARLASRIQHPNVVQTLDIVLDGGVAHVVMEYVHGATVAELFGEAGLRGERASHGVAVGILVDALEGLHAAHEARDASGMPLGVVHRDVSPQNVHVGVDGHARLLDFGIAKALNRTQVTAAGEVKGKVAYMPREQLGGAPVTRQVDVYAAGVVLWELLTGRRLFAGGDLASLATRVVTETIAPPSRYAPEVSAALDQIVLRATAPDSRQRYGSAAEMAAALSASTSRADPAEIGAWVERLAGDALELRAESVKRAETAKIEELLPPRASSHRRLTGIALSAAAVAALFAGVAFAAARARSERPSEVGAAATATSATPSPTPTPAPAPAPTATPTATPTSLPTEPASSLPPRPRPPRRHPAYACDPPFSIAADGTKTYKPECLR